MTSAPPSPSPTVLIVDDEPNNLKVLARIVMEAGWQVRVEVEGKAAIAQCEANAPDLILLDVMLPDLNGFDVCQHLKQNPKTQHIPIIFMTALNSTTDRARGFQVGAVDYITKPFHIEDVLARLTVHLKIRQMERLLHHKNHQLERLNAKLQQQVHHRSSQLKVSQTTLQSFLDNAHDLIQSVSLTDGRFLFVNKAWLTTLGYSSADLKTLTLFDILHPDYAPHCLPLFEQLQRGDVTEFTDLDICLLAKSGEYVYLEGNTKSYPGADIDMGTWGIFRDVTERRRIDAQLRRSLQEKENLLKEIHHRVKNNLLIVSSLMDWKCELSNDASCQTLFADSQKRIQAMALIHEKLYGSQDLARINVGEYLLDLAQQLTTDHRNGDRQSSITLDCRLDPLYLNLETATPCGLIVNELVLNALTHGFGEGEGGQVTLELSRQGEKEYLLVVQDDGRGMPENFDPDTADTLGWQLITLLTQQLDGSIHIIHGGGTRVELRFTELDYPTRF